MCVPSRPCPRAASGSGRVCLRRRDGKGGNFTLYLGGKQVGSGRIDRSESIGFGYEYTDVGRDAQSPVTDDYGRDSRFTGIIKWVEIEGG